MSLFQELETMLNTSESLTFSITKSGGELTALITPKLSEEPANASDDVKRARAALAMPIRIKATAQELDAGLVDALKDVNVQRNDLSESMTALMDSLKESKKEAKVASQKNPAKGKSKVTPKKGDEVDLDDKPSTEVSGTVAKPESATTAVNPASL
jgi:PRTRC genetic system protein E